MTVRLDVRLMDWVLGGDQDIERAIRADYILQVTGISADQLLALEVLLNAKTSTLQTLQSERPDLGPISTYEEATGLQDAVDRLEEEPF